MTANSSWTRKLVYDGTTGTKGFLTSQTDARGVRTYGDEGYRVRPFINPDRRA